MKIFLTMLVLAATDARTEAMKKMQVELNASLAKTRAEFTRTHPNPFYCTCGPTCPTPVQGKWPIPASMTPVKR